MEHSDTRPTETPGICHQDPLPRLTRKQKTDGEQPSGPALTDGDIAPVDVTSTDYARMADLVNLYKSLRWEPLMPRISLSPNRSG